MLTATEALKLAVEHHHAGRLDEAKAIYEAMVAQAPRNPELLRIFALLAEKSGQRETALRYIKGALALTPDACSVWVRRARLNGKKAAFRMQIEKICVLVAQCSISCQTLF